MIRSQGRLAALLRHTAALEHQLRSDDSGARRRAVLRSARLAGVHEGVPLSRHELARAWPQFRRLGPDAHLFSVLLRFGEMSPGAVADLAAAPAHDATLCQTLARHLSDERSEIRRMAHFGLMHGNVRYSLASATLVAHLRSERRETREMAAELLGNGALDPPTNNPDDLLRLLDDPAPGVRALGAQWMACVARGAIEQILRATEDPSGAVQRQAGFALAQVTHPLQSSVARLAALAERGNAETRYAGISGLKAFSRLGAGIDHTLWKAVRDRVEFVSASAANGLLQSGMDFSCWLSRFLDLQKSGRPHLREAGVRLLTTVQRAWEKAETALIAALLDPEPRISARAVEALTMFRRQAITPAGRARLLAMLPRATGRIATAIASLLAETDAGDLRVQRTLVEAMKSRDRETRFTAVSALMRLGSGATFALPVMIRALDDADVNVRSHAARSLPAFRGHRRVVPALLGALRRADRRGDQAQHRFAIESLASIGDRSARVLQAMRLGLCSREGLVRCAAAKALVTLGKAPRALVDIMRPELGSEQWYLRERAVEVLGLMGRAAGRDRGRIRALTRDPDARVREAARRALQRIGSAL